MDIGGRAHNLNETIFIAQTGLDFAEINLDIPHSSITERDLSLFLELKERYKIFYLGHSVNEGSPRDIERHRNYLFPAVVDLFDYLPLLGIRLFTMHYWLDRRFIAPEIVHEKIKLLKELSIRAEERSIILCLENLSEDTRDLFSPLNDIKNLYLTLDIGHGEILTERNHSFDLISLFSDRIKHVHIHDNRGGDSVRDDLHLPMGEGRIDFTNILTNLVKSGYDGTISLEVETSHMEKGRAKIMEILKGIKE